MGLTLDASRRHSFVQIACIVNVLLICFQFDQTCLAQTAPEEGSAAELPVPNSGPMQAEAGLIESDGASDSTLLSPLPGALTVADVIASVYRSFPEINRARQEFARADGQLLAAYGAYDTNVKAFSLSEPMGFYQNYRNGIAAARQTWWGGNLAAGYRIGRGFFQPWYRERETEKAGEFSLGWSQPLLQGRAIDPQRFAVFQASLARNAADPILQEAVLQTSRDAVIAYWDWVAAGATLAAQRDLLELAEVRGEQYQAGFEAGKFAEIDVILNDQLIAERRAKLIDTQRKFREKSFKLSLYIRDDSGQPLVPADDWLPADFPMVVSLPPLNIDQEIARALQMRPEPRRLQIELGQLNLDRRLAQNQTLPKVDFVIEGSQDIGAPASSADDKGPFQLIVGAVSEVPVQRRKARGKLREKAAKISQVNEKLRFQRDKIGVEVRTALTSLEFSAQVVRQSQLAYEAALETLQRYRFAFDRGKVDLIDLNLLEVKMNESEIKLIESQQLWFDELADYQAAIGLDPFEQADFVTQLPESDLRKEGIPTEDEQDAEALERDWQRRIGTPNEP